MLVKLDDTVNSDFGNNIRKIETAKILVKDDKLTDYAASTDQLITLLFPYFSKFD